MFKKTNAGYYQFEELKKFNYLVHGFSTRALGDCREKKNYQKFLETIGVGVENLVLAQQVHGNKIKVVKYQDRGKIISGVDGLLTRDWQVILGIRSADCLPILFWEPQAKIIGAAHAGWRGVLARLPQKMIDQAIKMGGLPENILVAIGPHICGKRYSVEKERAERFLKEFGKLKGMVEKNFLDLEVPTINQLFHSGVKLSNILSAKMCTSCHNNDFFSFRKNDKDDYGEILSVIGLVV
jgi:YfiH family protein